MLQKWLGNQLRKPNGILSKWVGRYMEKGNYEINKWTLDLLNINNFEVILEVGVGNGATLYKVAQKNKTGKNHGVDISKSMVKEAKKLNKKDIVRGVVNILEANVTSLPFTDDFFNKVYSVHTLYFWENLNQGFSEIYRVLKPDGCLFISILDKSHMEKMKRTEKFSLLSIQEIEDELYNNNFKEVVSESKGAYWCIQAKK